MLVLAGSVYDQMVATCLDGWPLEACGLLAGPAEESPPAHASVLAREEPVTTAVISYPATNAAHSSRVYTVAPKDLLRADRQAEDAGMVLLGVWHSHTHTDAYPSPTDVTQAPDPSWHYVLVSLRDTQPVLRSYRIVDDRVEEEEVALQW